MTGQPLDLDALAALEQAATPEPWIAEFSGKTGPVVIDGESGNALDHVAQCPHYRGQADAALIAALRNAAPSLIRRARGGIELGKSLVFWLDLAVLATDSQDCIEDDGDGDYGAVAERLTALGERARSAEVERDAARAELADLRERVAAALELVTLSSLEPAPARWLADDVRAALTTGGDDG